MSKLRISGSVFQKHSILTIVITAFIVWCPVLLIQFINDDYQILGYHSGKSFINIFQPFWMPDISGVYWRPVGNLIHPLVMYVAGFEPLPFRIVSLLSYIFCCVVFYNASGKLGISNKTSLLIALLFAVLPSHEFQVAWIADTGESLVAASLLLTFIFYENIYRADKSPGLYIFLSILFLIIALLIKEVAFTGIFIPFFSLIVHGDYKRYKISRTVRDTLAGILILILLLVYRYFVIGGTPFGSSHFQDSGPVKWVINFFLYLALSLFPAESLEMMLYYGDNLLSQVLIVISLIVLVYAFVKTFIRLSHFQKRIFIAGLVWFIIFVLPALPTLMRWYVFTASAGVMWMIGAIIEYLNTRSYKIYITPLILIIIASLSIYDFNLMLRWKNVSDHFTHSYESLRALSPEKEMTIWGVPDKLNRIPLMKLGIAETVQSAMNDTTIDVYAPLRVELTGFLSDIEVDSVTNSSIKFRLTGGRFLVERTTSRAVITGEQIDQEYEGYRFVINNSELESTVKVYFDSLKGEQYFYDGRRFRKIKMTSFSKED